MPSSEPEPQSRGGWSPDLLEQARAGDGRAREELIARYTPFVLRVAAQASGRYLRLGQDDEASVALIAFNEAIDRYDPARGAGFLPFGQQVIRRRLVDYFRSQGRHPETPFSALAGGDGEGEGGWEPAGELAGAGGAQEAEEQVDERLGRRQEIAEFGRELARFGLSLDELVRSSPRHRDTRQLALRVAWRVARTPAYRRRLLETGQLPLEELEADPELGVSRKTLRRLRSYLVAVVLLLSGDFPQLRAFLPLAPEEGFSGEGRSERDRHER